MTASQNNNWAEEIKRNTINLAYWTIAWTASMALATFGPIFIWENQAMTISGIVINLGLGAGMILANKRHLNGLDEMQKKIQLEAMAIALGVGIVSGLSYSLLDQTNVIQMDAEISHLVILIGLTYAMAIFIGRYRYK
ncbi:hypothetical protein SAMN04488029_3645 [Reichenbachiella faecimaris]|uniref:Uncharacterized protein n=1 Tax=Reichenbachiella faecimaris TaxID=692418 RepID=A0A1W2GN78_REIFA|nr:hypothetical protein [Reichenbachiella faecimaris]SMD38130.1 hypothetical protein SAMN04488029_3645 [Reichenbachiella faecimaris]